MTGVPRVAVTLEQCWHAVPGGTATSALAATAALDRRNDVELVGVSARHGGPPPAPFVPPIDTRPMPLPRLALYESWHVLRRPSVQSATGPIDAIWVTGGAVPPRSAPMVVTIHDLAFLHRPEHFTAKGRRFFRQATACARRDADLVLCPSQVTADDCAEHGFAPDRLRVAPWGVDQRRADAGEVAAVAGRHGLDRPYVLSVGTAEPRKNLGAVFAAFARLDRDDLDLVVVGPDGWREDVAALAGSVSRDRVRLLGFVPAGDLPGLYAGASVFCYPSLFEGFGLPVLEAMAQGTAVVTSTGTSMAEVGGDAVVLVDPADHGAVAGALGALLDDPEEAARLGAAARARAEFFTWDRTAEQVAAALREVAA
ncbi:MAG: glycosyltransferase family 4 protein [Acidimicrobiales bacterium]|nr:glycosyltransferase family 4 protein [Acidimicrobiales bacterium]